MRCSPYLNILCTHVPYIRWDNFKLFLDFILFTCQRGKNRMRFGLVNVMCDNSGLRNVSSCFQLHSELDENLCRMPILELFRDERVEKKRANWSSAWNMIDYLRELKKPRYLLTRTTKLFPEISNFFFLPETLLSVCVRLCAARLVVMRCVMMNVLRRFLFPLVSAKHSLFIQCKHSIFRQMCSIYAHKTLCIYLQQSLTLQHKRRRLFLYFTVIVCCHFFFQIKLFYWKIIVRTFFVGATFCDTFCAILFSASHLA